MRNLKFFICLIFCIALAIGQANGAAQMKNQAMFQNGPQHTGVYEGGASGNFKELKWKFKTEGIICSSPVVANGICYFGSGDTYFYAVDAVTGAEKWRFKTGGAVHSSAAIDGKIVCFVSMDGYLYALDTRSGKLKWKFATQGEKVLDGWDTFLSSPCIVKGVVYFGSGDGRLYAVRLKNGKKIWQFETGGIIHSSPAFCDNTVYFGNCEGYVFALDAKNGALKWKFKTDGAPDIPRGEILSSPSIYNGTIFIGSKDHTFYALNAVDGTRIWSVKVGAGWVVSTPAVKDGIVCFGRTGDYSINGYDANNAKRIPFGVRKWFFNSKYFIYSSAAVAGETVYIGSFNGKLLALDLKKGKEKWQFQTDGCKENYAKFFDENNRFRPDAPNVRFYNSKNGGYDSEGDVASIMTMGSVISSPCVYGEVLYFGSTDGNLYALQLE